MQVRAFAAMTLRRAKNDRLDAQLIAAFTALRTDTRAAPDPRLRARATAPAISPAGAPGSAPPSTPPPCRRPTAGTSPSLPCANASPNAASRTSRP
ncbi:MAG: hypothetical protein P0Y66_12025 [Candidatus Kaistia colombiensis]|nr:MAG: hypothetical protein P0Y66_12025 [Kaistia sp.]